MRRVVKGDTPLFWMEFMKAHPCIQYEDLNQLVEGKTLRGKIRSQLVQEQQYLCAYCCKSIDESNAHNEHIRPQSQFPQASMEYGNLIASCMTSGSTLTCGMRKGDQYDNEMFVSPLQHDCASHFEFAQDGRILGVTEQGQYTVDLLNLNAYSLKEARRALFCEELKSAIVCGKDYVYEYYIQPQNGRLPRFVDMTAYFYDNGYFDQEQ